MNRLNRVMNNLERLPAGWQTGVRSFIIGKIIPFAGTASCRVEKLTKNQKAPQGRKSHWHAARGRDGAGC